MLEESKNSRNMNCRTFFSFSTFLEVFVGMKKAKSSKLNKLVILPQIEAFFSQNTVEPNRNIQYLVIVVYWLMHYVSFEPDAR